MKTKSKTKKLSTLNTQQSTATPELQNRTEQLSENTAAETPTSDLRPPTSGSIKPFVNFAERDFNRKLPVEKVLEKLRRWMPKQYELAEVVGQWIWITFPEQPAETVRADLSQLGFHWNNTRKCWQHPCGEALPRGQQEPKQKYEVWFPRSIAALRQKKAQAAEAAAYDASNPYRYNGPARTAEQVAA